MSNKTFLLALMGMLATLLLVEFSSLSHEPVVIQTNLENLPMEIGTYQGAEDSFPESVYRELNADQYVYRHYRSGNGNQLNLYIGYYGTAKGGRTGHNPYACLPGAGWAIVDTGKVPVRILSHSSDVEVNYVQARRDGVNTVMVHWYQTAGDKVIQTGIQQNIERFLGRVLHNRNDGAYVQISMQASDDKVADARTKLQDFGGLVIPLLPKYWPIEK
jgi:EpsI family protein